MNNNLIVRYYNPFSGLSQNSMDLSSLGFNNENVMTIKESIDTCLNEDVFYKDKIWTVQAVANKLWPNNHIKKINFKRWFENYSKMFRGDGPMQRLLRNPDVVSGSARIEEFENLTNITDTESHIPRQGYDEMSNIIHNDNENLTWEYFTFINKNTPDIQTTSAIIRDITLEKLENNIVRTINTVFIKEKYETLPILAFYHDLRNRSTLGDEPDDGLVQDSLYQLGCDLQPIHSDMPLQIVSKLKIKDPDNHNNYENYLLVYVSELSFQEFSNLPIYNSLKPRSKIFKRYSTVNGNQENAYLNPINIFNLSFFIYQLKMLKLNVKLQMDKKYVIVGIMKQRYL